MNELADASLLALRLIGGADPELARIVGLSLRVSGSAALLAFLLGLPLAALLTIGRFRARGVALVLANAALGLPPVVVGLFCYLLLSRSGPLGPLGWLFRPEGMVMAQTILALPIVVALSHRILAPLWEEVRDPLRVDGAGPLLCGVELARMARPALATVFLAAFGRAIAEVGAILVVGGNIRGETRTMTTAIALETQKGDLPLALALGGILLLICLGVSAATLVLERRR
ncbi:ABC transporter permease [Pseudoroseomonas rhizosphaerae]|uniref:ABC transporter permease n=1 Tax=Teichococcus rhizosphaerae TaxID=1335062 RepID=A0A2C6XYD4_9PROT|nr:ABC transporter permease [Pseudoroseomonas rhizosphaerae]PHK93552.1 ABC transporter permease [Pseudoroseomonas rhizosphaerae]